METAQGGCLCGRVRFAIDLSVAVCAHCHCSMCRRAHGAAYVTWIRVSAEHFRIVAGAERLVGYQSSDHATRRFCGTCGSTLLFESTRYPDVIDVVLANLDDPNGITPQGHFYFDDRAPWVHVADGLPRFGGRTGMEPLR